jgi:hypothetical protein
MPAIAPAKWNTLVLGRRFALAFRQGRGNDAFFVARGLRKPVAEFPLSEDGWRLAWRKFSSLEPRQAMEYVAESRRRAAAPAPTAISHSGSRYLLGQGADFFGIWDRDKPGGPVQRFPLTDGGWREAGLAYQALGEGQPARPQQSLGRTIGTLLLGIVVIGVCAVVGALIGWGIGDAVGGCDFPFGPRSGCIDGMLLGMILGFLMGGGLALWIGARRRNRWPEMPPAPD